MTNRARSALAIMVCSSASIALADPPPGYYNPITATDPALLQTQLSSLLNSALTRSYNDARDLLQVIEEDPNNLANIILVYNGQSVVSTWDSGGTWNREHTWPVSLGVGESGSDYSDLHQLHACNPSVNSSRGNKQFGTLPGQWDPNQFGKVYRGRMARVAFYMKTRYSYLNMALLGNQQQLIDWHIAEMPGATDDTRNDRVYAVQQNRNAFADRPEWVWALFGTGPSDAQIILAGESPANGSTTQNIDLGLRIGQPSEFPEVTIDLAKTGAAPTTYRLVASGDVAEVSDYQFGLARNAQAASHDVTITGSAFGPFAGTLTIDTTEITSAGAGLGAADGDDTVTITGFAIDHALASLDELSTQSSLIIDLGQFDVGESAPAGAFSVWNIAPALFSANLDIDSVSITGNAAAFTTDLAPAAGIAPGTSADFTVSFDTQNVGTYEALATIEVSDENLPGAAGPTLLTVTFRGKVVGACVADVNGDGTLSPADFGAWISAFNAQSEACDQNGDSLCSPADFGAWITNFNAGC